MIPTLSGIEPAPEARRGSRVVIREATPADNKSLCELFAGISMEADLGLSIRRDPDFSALYRIQSEQWECWVGELDGTLVGLGSMLARDAYLDGQPVRAGYLGDLRIRPEVPGSLRLLARLYGPALRAFSARSGCDVYLTTIIASNARALRALTSGRSRQLGIPKYELLHRFDIRAVHLTLPRRPRSELKVRRALPADVPAIARFLDDDARRRPLGYVFTEDELWRRLRAWPGLEISNFYLAFDRQGTLAGCLAIWDASAVKRTVVTGYRGSMRWVKLAYDLAGTMLRVPRLPNVGSAFRYAYVTHQAIGDDDSTVFRALLDAAYVDCRRQGFHFISACVFENDPLEPAFAGFQVTNLPAHLYAVMPGGHDLTAALRSGLHPGFEMALV